MKSRIPRQERQRPCICLFTSHIGATVGALGQTSANIQMLISVPHVGGWGPKTWTIFHCLLGYINRKSRSGASGTRTGIRVSCWCCSLLCHNAGPGFVNDYIFLAIKRNVLHHLPICLASFYSIDLKFFFSGSWVLLH